MVWPTLGSMTAKEQNSDKIECNNPAHYITPRRPIKPTAHNCGSLSTTYELVCIRPAGDRPTDGLATRYLCTLYRSLFGTDDKKLQLNALFAVRLKPQVAARDHRSRAGFKCVEGD